MKDYKCSKAIRNGADIICRINNSLCPNVYFDGMGNRTKLTKASLGCNGPCEEVKPKKKRSVKK